MDSNKVIEHFKEISKIPRGSGKEKAISDYLYSFFSSKNLEVEQDDKLNILVKVPASEGYEEYSPLILQGHMDMVWEKNKDKNFNFLTDPIEILEKDGFLTANGTTLGADNGIAVAMMMAILDSNIKHPKLELLITTDEEMGMSGANGFDISKLQGHTMINLDTEEDDKIYVSSAGGCRVSSLLDFETERVNIGDKIFKIEITGLHGGHSGADIHKKYGNANKLITEFIRHINLRYETCIVDIHGGDKDNAIPREAEVTFTTPDGSDVDLTTQLNFICDILNMGLENDEKITYKLIEVENKALDKLYKLTHKETSRLIQFLTHYPNGVRTMSKKIEGLVQTSLNLSVIKTIKENDKISVSVLSLVRSSDNEELDDLVQHLAFLTNKFEGKTSTGAQYKAWEYKENSEIRKIFERAFYDVTNTSVKSAAIHAGLECGLFIAKNKDLDIISIGPNIFSPHTPNEKIEIASIQKIWNILVRGLEIYNVR